MNETPEKVEPWSDEKTVSIVVRNNEPLFNMWMGAPKDGALIAAGATVRFSTRDLLPETWQEFCTRYYGYRFEYKFE